MIISTVHLPDELIDRLATEAARRGISIDEVAAEALAARFPGAAPDTGGDALEAFIGSGDSDDPAWAGRNNAELRKDAATPRAG